jgi:hypothetical protein
LQKEQEAKPKKKRRSRKSKKYNPGEPDPKAQKNFTDPESRIMKSSDKSFIQGYNAQAAVDAKSQIIAAADVTNNASDCNQLKAQIAQVKENTGRKPKEVSADAGYYSEPNVKFLIKEEIEPCIPPEKVKHSEWRTMAPAPWGRIPCEMSIKDQKRRKIRTKLGRKRYKLRQTTVEPVFGFIKEQFGLRQFLLRGL